ncbi:MAG: MBL fold metallo-hydrolase, partial [Patescibacteria group bacterium]|nr:MBL fold metallo-hydrolase [Patescibacteria group bacterium]
RVFARAWETNAAQSDLSEQAHPALGYLRNAAVAAIDDIRRTRVEKGLAVWFIYNMGHVFKTPTTCFAIDLSGRRVEALATELDLLLTTHEHKDHYSEPLIRAMLQAGKPVVTRWFPGTTILNESTNLTFGDLRVRVDVGDHHYRNPDQRNNMLMYEVACGPEANNAVIYHCGDNSNIEKITPSRPIDLLIVHVSVGLPIPETIERVNPKTTLISHVLELGHSPLPPHAWRWSYDFAFDVIRETPPDRAAVLTWGERWLLPGTRLTCVDAAKTTSCEAAP